MADRIKYNPVKGADGKYESIEEVSSEPVRYKSNISTTILPDSVSIGNDAAFKILSEGDEEPYFFVNTVMLGDKYKTLNYPPMTLTKEWGESFAKGINAVPSPMYIKGHEDSNWQLEQFRIPGDGYLVGGKVTKIDGDDALVLKNYLLKGDTEEKKALSVKTVRELKSGMLSTSTGDIHKRRVEFDEDGDAEYYVIESIKGRTNALVEHDMTGSHANIVGTNFKQGTKSTVGGSNDIQGDEEMAAEPKEMTIEEMMVRFKNLANLGKLDGLKLSSELGIDVKTPDEVAGLLRLKAFEDVNGNITNYLKAEEARQSEEFDSLVANELKEAFKNETVALVAKALFSIKKGTKVEVLAEIERVKTEEAVLKLRSDLASNGNFVPGSDNDTGDNTGEEMEG